MLPLKPISLCSLYFLLFTGFTFGQWSPSPAIYNYGGEAIDTLFLSDSTFCKGDILTIVGDHFLDVSIAEVWDSLSLEIGNTSCFLVYIDSLTVKAQIPDLFINDTCMKITLTKYTHSLFGSYGYLVEDTVCLIGDYIRVSYPDSTFCLGDINPQPIVILSPSAAGIFCCLSGPPGFQVMPNGTIPLHSGAVGVNNQFEFQSQHPICPDTLSFSIDILSRSSSSYGMMGGDSTFCPIGFGVVDTALIFPSGGSFVCHASGIAIVDDSLGVIDLANSQPGGYQLWYLPFDPCYDSISHLVTIIDQDDPGFIYNPAFYCLSDPDPLPQITGDGGGIFSAVTPNTTVAANGRLDLQISGPGNHSVRYVTTGVCPDSSDFGVVINNAVSGYFSYSSSAFCMNDTNPIPQVNSPGGTFTSGNGLIIDSLNGKIDLGISQPGVYTVVYSFVGSCQTTFSQTISIQPWDTLTRIDFGEGPFCKDSLPVIPELLGDSLGNFSVQGGAVFFASSNGAIDLVASPVGGPFIITYDIVNPCALDVSDTIYISEAPQLELVYPVSEACIGGTPISIDTIQSHLHFGVFSFSSGLAADGLGTVFPELSQVGTHYVSYSSLGACPAEVSVPWQINPTPANAAMDIYPGDSVCEGEQIRASLSGSDAIAFGFKVNGEVVDSSFFVFETEDLVSGDLLTGYVRNAYGCLDSFPHRIFMSPRPETSILVPGEIITGDKSNVQLSVDLDSSQLQWWIEQVGIDTIFGELFFGIGGVKQSILVRTGRNLNSPVLVRVAAVSSLGSCIGDTISSEYIVLDQKFFIPEVITPNGDGKNDTWLISYPPEIDPFDFQVRLFNRAGGEVFRMSPIHSGFDGAQLPEGVYWWTLDTFDGKHVQSGGLTIRR